MSGAPGFWMNEASGVLQPAILAYLRDEPMTGEQIAAMRAYLRQWIMAEAWIGVDALRDMVDGLTSRAAIDAWLDLALDLNIDPL